MRRVMVVGAGGNIGSQVVSHVGRMAGVTDVLLVDRDCYDASNRVGQAIDVRDVGRPKVAVQKGRLRRVNPDLTISAVRAPAESLPLGAFRADVILVCLDSRRGRMHVNQAAWRLGTTWINAGVDGEGLLARVQVFVPGAEAACLECPWDESDYNAVEQDYPCQGDGAALAAPTGAPSQIGALAAALQAVECVKVLDGQIEEALIGRDLLLDVRRHRHYVTTFRRNPACRMPDHAGWRIEPLGGSPDELTLGDVLALGSALRGAGDRLVCSIAGQRVAMHATCTGCRARSEALRLEHRPLPRACRRCGAVVRPTGFDLHDAVALGDIPALLLDLPVSRAGVVKGDVVTLVTPAVEVHYEIGGAP